MKKLLLPFTLCLFASLPVMAYHHGDSVRLEVANGCSACAQAERVLHEHHIPFTTSQGHGFVPQLYVNNKYKGTGLGAVENYANS